MTKIRYKIDNQVYDIIWKAAPGMMRVELRILYDGQETVVLPTEILEWLP